MNLVADTMAARGKREEVWNVIDAARDVLSKVAPNVYMFGSSLPLSFLEQGGAHELGLTLEDAITGVDRKTTYVFHLPEK